MTKDQNKHITNIEYNHLNLPTAIHFDNNRNIVFGYDANGVKMKKEVTSNTIDKLTLYMDGFQYLNKQANSVNNKTLLQFFPTAEGYVKPIYKATLGTVTAPKYQYVYNYTDHLGNIRLQYSKVQGVLKVLEETHYYPFGLKHGSYNQSRLKLVRKPSNDSKTTKMVSVDRSYKYKYNGKELQEEFGLDWYDYGARNLGSDVGRWNVLDPLAEGYERWSPYTYSMNNPIYFIDPDGKRIRIGDDLYSYKKHRDYDAIKNEFERNAYMALDKLYSTGAMNIDFGGDIGVVNVLDKIIEDKNYTIDITQSKGEVSRYGSNKLKFADKFGVAITTKAGVTYVDLKEAANSGVAKDGVGFNSPTAQLGHELIHAYHSKYDNEPIKGKGNRTIGWKKGSYMDRKFTHKDVKPYFKNEEERRITTLSNQINEKLNEAKRYDYRGAVYKTESPTSTKPLKVNAND